jgi:hypothetical protein
MLLEYGDDFLVKFFNIGSSELLILHEILLEENGNIKEVFSKLLLSPKFRVTKCETDRVAAIKSLPHVL